jgi:hypothetical protein
MRGRGPCMVTLAVAFCLYKVSPGAVRMMAVRQRRQRGEAKSSGRKAPIREGCGQAPAKSSGVAHTTVDVRPRGTCASWERRGMSVSGEGKTNRGEENPDLASRLVSSTIVPVERGSPLQPGSARRCRSLSGCIPMPFGRRWMDVFTAPHPPLHPSRAVLLRDAATVGGLAVRTSSL